MADPKRIWLQPACCADRLGRVWCEHADPEDCEDGVPWTEYVRADAAIAERDEAVRLLRDVRWPVSEPEELTAEDRKLPGTPQETLFVDTGWRSRARAFLARIDANVPPAQEEG